MISRWGTDRPLVSCLMVTQAKRWVGGVPPVGAMAFEAQSYEPRELIVVSADPLPEMADFCAHLNDGKRRVQARFFDVTAESGGLGGGWTLGALRNLAVEMAEGEFVATWDDDDVSAPQRLAAQVRTLLDCPLFDGCVLGRVMIDDVQGGAQPLTSPFYEWPMTMLARRAGLPPFPPLEKSEDVAVLNQLRRVIALDRPELFTYRINHGTNVSADAAYARGLAELLSVRS